MPDPKRPWKALGAFALAFLGALLATIQGRTDLDTMTATDWLIVVGSALVTAGTVYQIKNPVAPAGGEG